MFANDLEVFKKDDLYYLMCGDQYIQCSDSEDLVADRNRQILWFIIEDLDRFGNFKIKKNKLILDKETPNAYYIFSAQKLIVEEQSRFQKFSYDLFQFFINDLSLVQVANGGAAEVREAERLFPIRSAIIKQIGDKKFDALTSYAWESYYARFNLDKSNYSKNLQNKSTDELEVNFRNDDLSKDIFELFSLATNAEKACIITLFYCLNCASILIPIAFVKKWVTKREFITAAMGLGGNVVDTASVHGTNKDHNDLYKYFDQFAVICSDYVDESTPPLLSKISKGESKKQEFKESLSLDVRKQNDKSYYPKKEKYIEESVLKTIAGFLNSEGGELFIGVDDKSRIVGIQNELDIFHQSSTDKILLHLKNLIKTNIGVGFSNLININLENLNNLDIVHIICKESDKEVFIKGKDFYARLGPSTHKLEGKELLEYSKSRFT